MHSNYIVSNVKSPKVKVITDCSILECAQGGLARLVNPPNEVMCTDVKVGRYEDCSFFIKNPECNNLISKYHVINQNEALIETMLEKCNFKVKPYLTKQKDGPPKYEKNLLRSINDWFKWLKKNSFNFEQLINQSQYQSTAEWWKDFEMCTQIVHEELRKREEHFQKCVCISDENHTFRLQTLRDHSQLSQNFQDEIVRQVCNTNNVGFLRSDFAFMYFIMKFTNSFSKYKTNGDIEFKNDSLSDLLVFNPLFQKLTGATHHIHHIIQTKFKYVIDNLYNNMDMFDINSSGHVTCVEISATSEAHKIKIDWASVAQYVYTHKNFIVDPEFLKQYVNLHGRQVLYKSCFYGMIKYNYTLIQRLCQHLNELEIDNDIKGILIEICTLINSNSGANSNILKWIYKPGFENRIKEIVPNLQSSYKQLLSTSTSSKIFTTSSYKATGDLLKDIKYLKETVLIDLIVGFEGEWYQFESEYSYRPYENKRQKTSYLRVPARR